RIDSRPGVSPGDLRSIERRGQETLAERVPNGGLRRPSPNESRTAGSGDPHRTSPERRAQETLAERVPNGGARRPSPNESRTAGRRQEPLRRNGPTAFTLCHRAGGTFRAPFALPSQ